jgi:GAF domain-containing protein
MITVRPTFEALVRAAVEATGAERGWLLRLDGNALTVIASFGHPGASDQIGSQRGLVGIAGFVTASSQPAAVRIRPDDADNLGAGGADGVPRSVLAAACGVGEVRGVLEVVDGVGGSFSFDDVETLSLLADIAGAALSEDDQIAAPPAPAVLAHALDALAGTDAARYAEVARAIEALL